MTLEQALAARGRLRALNMQSYEAEKARVKEREQRRIEQIPFWAFWRNRSVDKIMRGFYKDYP